MVAWWCDVASAPVGAVRRVSRRSCTRRKDPAVCQEVQRSARTWAKNQGYKGFDGGRCGSISEPISGSRWLVRARDGVYGYAVSYGVVDESWGVAPGIVEDGLEPTDGRAEVAAVGAGCPTAHSRGDAAVPDVPPRCARAVPAFPESTLIVEWSAHRDVEITRSRWHGAQASPCWSKGRERLIRQRLDLGAAGQLLDDDPETDPVELVPDAVPEHYLAGSHIVDGLDHGVDRPGAMGVTLRAGRHRQLQDLHRRRGPLRQGCGESLRWPPWVTAVTELDGSAAIDSWAEAFDAVRMPLFGVRACGQLLVGPGPSAEGFRTRS